MNQDLIIIDKSYIDCTAINTEKWLTVVLGDEIELVELNEYGDKKYPFLSRINDVGHLMWEAPAIRGLIEAETGVDYEFTMIENVYNHENDFSDVFQYVIFHPKGEDYLYCDNVYVAVEISLGGDPRGAYGRIRLYQSEDLADHGFFDWMIGWAVIYEDTGEPVPENERFSQGYSSNPYYEMAEHLAKREGRPFDVDATWNEERSCFRAVYQDGRPVNLYPDLWIN